MTAMAPFCSPPSHLFEPRVPFRIPIQMPGELLKAGCSGASSDRSPTTHATQTKEHLTD